MTNPEFFARYAAAGRIGLVGGTAPIDQSIKKAQKKITSDKKSSPFSHAFIFSGVREDNSMWVFESDLEFHRRHIRIGVQENRIDKYYNEELYPNIAILDFDLQKDSEKIILGEALNILAARGKYSLREILGVMLSLNNKSRKHSNIFSRDNSFFCSAFVQHCYSKCGISFNENISLKHITPSDIHLTSTPHRVHQLIRETF